MTEWEERLIKKQEWLASLKIGDKVIYKPHSYYSDRTIETVVGETPKFFRLSNKVLLHKTEGRTRGYDGYVEAVTDELLEDIRKKQRLLQARKFIEETSNKLCRKDSVIDSQVEDILALKTKWESEANVEETPSK